MKSLKEIIEESFGQYAGAVAQSRAFVDARDGLKPSTRQINYCLYTDKFTPDKPFKKTLKAIGSLFRLYIHGDASAEGILMRSGQPFSMRYPLTEVEGNGGNLIQSGNWAAPRYTGARLSNFSVLLFQDIEKNTIDDWRDNYDDTEKYPAVLPSKGFYNIVNGTMGIGVGISSSIPQFNLKDVNKALEILLLNPNATFEEIYCPPDFATGAYLINEDEVKQALKYGSKKNASTNGEEGASCKLRAKMDYNEKEKCFCVTEIPYSVYTNTICGQLEAILEDNENNPGIDRFIDLTGEKPLIKIYLKKGINPNTVKDYLYKNTSLQYFYSINMTMLDEGKYPKVFTWKEALQAHIDHEKIVYRRGFLYDLEKIKNRIHIINGLLICLASIDEVVKVIKSSNSTADARNNLIKSFLLDELQAKAVLDMKLSRLAHLEVEKLEKEKENLIQESNKISNILNNEKLFNQELIRTWREIASIYGDDHRTKIISLPKIEEPKVERKIITNPKDVIVVISEDKIKLYSKEDFKVQRRGGKGIKNKSKVDCLIEATTNDQLLAITSLGRLYSIFIGDLSEENSISDIFTFSTDERITAISKIKGNKKIPEDILFCTKQGVIKKMKYSTCSGARNKKGISVIKIKENDKVISMVLNNGEDILIITKDGFYLRLSSSEINCSSKVAMGNKGISLGKNDRVVSMLSIEEKVGLLISSIGEGKRFSFENLSLGTRANKGNIIFKTNDKEKVSLVLSIEDEEQLLIVGENKHICIKTKDAPLLSGNATKGNYLMKDDIVKMAVVF